MTKSPEEIQEQITLYLQKWKQDATECDYFTTVPRLKCTMVNDIYTTFGGDFYPPPIFDPDDDELWNCIENIVNRKRLLYNPDISKNTVLSFVAQFSKEENVSIPFHFYHADVEHDAKRIFTSLGGELSEDNSPRQEWNKLWCLVKETCADCIEEYKLRPMEERNFYMLIKAAFGDEEKIIHDGKMSVHDVRFLLQFIEELHQQEAGWAKHKIDIF